ncbi:MAG: alpha/beta fold hydrolase [Allosphingosinicella sp.]|uniref:alpha/beta fold hydrolase n=1 Tax=Allosphingosinicella sp. TaxID=2823234 RepID=UPI00394DCBDD
MRLKEAGALAARVYRGFGRLGERGPSDGPKLMVIPGFLATDRTTLGLQRALAEGGFRVSGWGLGLNRRVTERTVDAIADQIARFGAGEKVILVGWSLGGLYARVVAQERPELVERVVTLGSPFSGDRRRNNNVWRLYEWVAGHHVNHPPIDRDPAQKPPVPTLAIWSRRDGIVSVDGARGKAEERDAELEVDCTHMGFGVSGKAYPQIVAAIRSFHSAA